MLSHPIQYQAPMLQHFAASGRLDVHTVYIRNLGTSAYYDPGFGTTLHWDVPLTDGHSHEFLPSIGPTDRITRFTPLLRGLPAAVRRFRPDAVWAHGYDHVNAIRLLTWAKSNRVPALVRADVEWSDAHGGSAVRALKTLALRGTFPLVDGFLAIGRRNRQFYADHGVPGRKLFNAPYAVDNARFAAARGAGGPDALSRAHGLPTGRPAFLFAGKLIERKRPRDAVRAVAMLRDQFGIDANLVVVGSGDLEVEVKEQIGALGLEDRVALAGFLNQQEIAGAYARCTALLLTSSRERWGLVANEAMAAGAPVVTYRSVGCAEDLVVDGLSGRVVGTADVEGLAAALADLARPQYRDELAAGALRRVADFSYAAIEDGVVAALEVLQWRGR
jgi:glycosyltransferase involved in cell wall biosynthesis